MNTNPVTLDELDALCESAPTEEMYRALFELRKMRTSLPVQTLQGEWKSDLPTSKGYWWYRAKPDDEAKPAVVWDDGDGGRLVVGDFWDPTPLEYIEGQWWSIPINEPPSSPQTESPVPQMESNSQ